MGGRGCYWKPRLRLELQLLCGAMAAPGMGLGHGWCATIAASFSKIESGNGVGFDSKMMDRGACLSLSLYICLLDESR